VRNTDLKDLCDIHYSVRKKIGAMSIHGVVHILLSPGSIEGLATKNVLCRRRRHTKVKSVKLEGPLRACKRCFKIKSRLS
jgi:hypothetical protein